MFVCENLIYLQLQKTGCSQVTRLLEETVGGEQRRKHGRLDEPLSGRLLVGSIRNPWDWYVSLWAFGCSGRGAIRRRLTHPRRDKPWRAYVPGRSVPARSLRTLGEQARSTWAEATRPIGRWLDLYEDVDDRERFRAWLRLLLAEGRALDLGNGFGHSRLAGIAGLMTYRHAWLHWRRLEPLFEGDAVTTPGALRSLDEALDQTQATIRTEHLEADLIDVIERAGYDLGEDARARILAASHDRTNRSRHHPSSYYYDDATRDLVARYDALLIEKYGYAPPPS